MTEKTGRQRVRLPTGDFTDEEAKAFIMGIGVTDDDEVDRLKVLHKVLAGYIRRVVEAAMDLVTDLGDRHPGMRPHVLLETLLPQVADAELALQKQFAKELPLVTSPYFRRPGSTRERTATPVFLGDPAIGQIEEALRGDYLDIVVVNYGAESEQAEAWMELADGWHSFAVGCEVFAQKYEAGHVQGGA